MPRQLTHFHREWHASLEDRGKRFFNDETSVERGLDFRQILQMIAALRSVSTVEARPEYVKELRIRLMAEAKAGTLVPATDDM